MQILESYVPSKYQTIALIGRGGMAEVSLAVTHSRGVTKLAVLKSLWPELEEDTEFVEMFLDEAGLCARLNHPNVVQTFEVLRHEGRLAMAMEYLDGQSLRHVLKRLAGANDMSVAMRLRIMTSVLAGLDHAHDLCDFDGAPLHVVHRDVSPHNVFITYDGHVKLVDFGIAKTMAAQHQTRPGALKGKIAYMAPEAVRGEIVDRRSDVYAAGVMLWELLAGRRYWEHVSESNIAWRLAAGPRAPELPPDLDIPEGLRDVCARALALDPMDRYQTAGELAVELERFGAAAAESHARHLGRLVSSMFDAERAQRRALIDLHLRVAVKPPRELEPSLDYASFAVERATRTPTPGPARRPRRLTARTLTVAAAAAMVLAFAGYVRSNHARLPSLPWSEPAAVAAPSALQSPPLETIAAARTAVIEPLPRRQATAPVAREDRHERDDRRGRRRLRAHHARPLDLLSDDVLDLDGEPLRPPLGSGVSHAAND